MPKLLLTDRRIAGLKPTATQREYFDKAFPGFAVRVSQQGGKAFVLFYRNADRRLKRLTLGTFGTTPPGIGLAKARALARAELQKATVGRDPSAERQQAKVQTFGALAGVYIEKHAKRRKRSWRDDARMIRMELDGWKGRPVASIRRADVRELLEAIVERGAPVLANRVLSLVRKMLNFALDQEWIDANAAQRMARPAAEQSRSRVLTPNELRTIWQWLDRDATKGADATERRYLALNQAALKLRLVTAQRGGEVVSMRWADLDLDGKWWTIPAEHAKNKMQHRVPLTATAIKILKALRTEAADDAVHVFGGIRGTRQRRGALDGLELKDVRPHDFRRTAATTMASAGISRLVIAKVLNHAEKGITAVYDRATYDAEKRVALETWARHLTGIIEKRANGNVKSFTKRA